MPVLAAIALLPTLTLFHPLVLTTIGQAALDFRLLLTAGTGLAVGSWVVVRPQRPDLVGSLLLGFLALLTVLTLVNDVSPLHALPVLGGGAPSPSSTWPRDAGSAIGTGRGW